MMLSGKIHFINEIMKRENIPIEEAIIKYKDEINFRYDVDKIISPTVFLRKYSQYFK